MDAISSGACLAKYLQTILCWIAIGNDTVFLIPRISSDIFPVRFNTLILVKKIRYLSLESKVIKMQYTMKHNEPGYLSR
jgi:hypothetical protein